MGRGEPALDLLGEDGLVTVDSRTGSPRTGFGTAVALILALGASALAGCSSQDPAPGPEAVAQNASPTPAPTPVPEAPRRGACYRLTVESALHATNATAPVPCTEKHTAETISVGRIQPVVDGHLLAIDSAQIQRQVATRCRALVDRHVGGSTQTQRLSRVQAVWFTPTLAQSDLGALWFRCDLVIVSGTKNLVALPKKTAGMLSRAGALDRYGTCGTAAPAAKSFTRVICGAAHNWRARTTVALPSDATYLAKAAGAAADKRCRAVAADRTPNADLRWSFEWPTKAQWNAGQRYGLCWTPD